MCPAKSIFQRLKTLFVKTALRWTTVLIRYCPPDRLDNWAVFRCGRARVAAFAPGPAGDLACTPGYPRRLEPFPFRWNRNGALDSCSDAFSSREPVTTS